MTRDDPRWPVMQVLKKEVQKSGLKHAACAEKVAYLEVSIGLKSS